MSGRPLPVPAAEGIDDDDDALLTSRQVAALFDVVVFDSLARTVAEHLIKGHLAGAADGGLPLSTLIRIWALDRRVGGETQGTSGTVADRPARFPTVQHHGVGPISDDANVPALIGA